jgi:hypothetical protein
MLYRTAYSLLDNPADAEDVPQTIFLRLLRSGLPRDLQRNPGGRTMTLPAEELIRRFLDLGVEPLAITCRTFSAFS